MADDAVCANDHILAARSLLDAAVLATANLEPGQRDAIAAVIEAALQRLDDAMEAEN